MINKIKCALVRKLINVFYWLAKKLDSIASKFVWQGMSDKDFDNYLKYTKFAIKARDLSGACKMYLIEHK